MDNNETKVIPKIEGNEENISENNKKKTVEEIFENLGENFEETIEDGEDEDEDMFKELFEEEFELPDDKEEEVDNNGNVIETYLTQMSNTIPGFEGLEEIGAMLAMDDEQFNQIAIPYLLHLQRSVNNMNDRMLLIQGLNAAGYKAEDLMASYVAVTEEIDTQLGDLISASKRDFVKQMLAIVTNTIADTEGIAKRIIQIPLQLICDDAKIPTYAHIGDAGCDVYAIEDCVINPGETKIISTGLKMAIPEGYEIQVRPRSGMSAKTKMRVANAPGTIDSCYRGEIGIIIENIEPNFKDIDYTFNEDGSIKINSIVHGSAFYVTKGDRIAQLVLNEVPKAAFYLIKDIGEYSDLSLRGDEGFGSTDEKKENGENTAQ